MIPETTPQGNGNPDPQHRGAPQAAATTGPAGRPARPRRKRPLSPLVADAQRLAKLLLCGVRSIRTWDAGGKLPRPIRLGTRVVWIVSEIRAWLDAGAPEREQWELVKRAGLKGGGR